MGEGASRAAELLCQEEEFGEGEEWVEVKTGRIHRRVKEAAANKFCM